MSIYYLKEDAYHSRYHHELQLKDSEDPKKDDIDIDDERRNLRNNNIPGQEELNFENESTIFEGCYIGTVLERAKIPADLKLSVEDVLSASKFKSKTTAILKFAKENEYTEKQISKLVYAWYWAIIGNTFGSKDIKKYEPKMSYYLDLVNQYCDDKQKARIKKDIEQTITAIEKLEEKNKAAKEPKDISLNLAYLKDIKHNINKLK